MCGRALLAAASILLALRARAAGDDGAEERQGPVGSRQVTIEARPFLLSLQRKGKGHVCDASLVARPWLLTAAHCLYERTQLGCPNNYFVVGGITDLTGCYYDLIACVETEGAQIGQPELFVVHPNYDVSRSVGNDLAMVRLRRKMNLGKRVNLVDLPRGVLDPRMLTNDTICSVTWWLDKLTARSQEAPASGPQDWDRVARRLLFVAYLPLLDVDECSCLLKRQLEHGVHLCTYAEGLETCGSDSGSPLVCDGVQVGVVSSDRPLLSKVCMDSVPGVYARVDTHVCWLRTVLAAAPPPPRACVSFTLCLIYAINCLFS